MTKYLKHLLKYPFHRPSRRLLRKFNRIKKLSLRLIMTLVVRNEEDIIEKHIRFHKAMGVDGFIVLNHKSTDKTAQILEKLKDEGIVYEVIYKDTPAFEQNVWLDEMVKLAKNKYKADWVINSDADEFYYSKELNLKTSIAKYIKNRINVLIVDSLLNFPQNEEDFLSNKYFVIKFIKKFEQKILNIENNKKFDTYKENDAHNGLRCSKVIFATKDFKKAHIGNHWVEMKNSSYVISSNINLYHYHIRNYKGYEEKIIRYLDSARLMPEGQGTHMKEYIELYKSGKLKEDYDNKYGKEMLDFLLNEGVVVIDKSVSNFLKLHNL